MAKSKRKSIESKRAETKDVFVSTWKFMKDLEFREDNYIPRQTDSNFNASCDTDFQY